MGLAAMLTPLCAQQTTDGERQRELMRQADDLYRKQKYASAQQLYDQVSGQGSVVSGRWADYKGDFVTVSDAAYYAGVCSEKLDNNDAEIVPLVVGESKNYLPEVFTLEFDYYCNGDAEEDFNANYHLWFRDATNSDLGEVSISTEDRLNWSLMKTNDEWVDGTSDKLTEFEKKNAWNHFSLLHYIYLMHPFHQVPCQLLPFQQQNYYYQLKLLQDFLVNQK